MTKQTTPKVGIDVAEAEFEKFADAMDLDFSLESISEEDKKGFEQQKKRFIDAICEGSMIINDNGEPEYTPKRGGEKLVFHEPTGASLMAMDRRKKNEDIGKMYALMGEITRTDASTFSKMKNADLKVCIAITTLFLG